MSVYLTDELSEIVCVPINQPTPSIQNDELYRPINPNDPDIISLADSIAERGVLEPLVLGLCNTVVSGHRRLAAAKVADLYDVPVRFINVDSRKVSADEWLTLLREFNRQREKTFAERVREEVASADPDVAYAALLAHREEKTGMPGNDGLSRIDTAVKRQRSHITPVKALMVQAVTAIIHQRRSYWPLSDRQIHYALLNDPPLRHSSKPASTYRNNAQSYDDLTNLLTRGRISGLFPWACIADETRPVSLWKTHLTVGAFIQKQLSEILTGYWRDLTQSQPNHVEIVAEKLTVKTMVDRVASRYCVPTTIGRGYSSIVPRKGIADRFNQSGRDKLTLLVLGDLDPDGVTIGESLAQSLVRDFYIDESRIDAIRVGIVAEQVKRYALKPTLEAKSSSSTYKQFVERYGKFAYELEAIPPEALEKELADALDKVLDTSALNHEMDAEKTDAARLSGIKRAVLDSIKGIDFEGGAA